MGEVRRLRELAEAGVPLEAIAEMLGRTRSAIRNKAGLHAISLKHAIMKNGKDCDKAAP